MTKEAFEHKATRFRDIALQAAVTAGADADTAEDIAQETMLRLWQMHDDPRLYNPEGYATMIARHLTLNHLRSKPPLPLNEQQAACQSVPSPLDLMLQREDERWLQERIRNLPYTQHAILKLRQVEHRSNEEIAKILGIQPSSVSTLLAKARRQLLEEIRQQRNTNRQ
jgi:RNA polymerase sigma-70 factor (ECF subfamily)